MPRDTQFHDCLSFRILRILYCMFHS